MPRRAVKLAALLGLLVSFASPAFAQVQPDPPPTIAPLKIADDRNGVNISSGKITVTVY